MPVCAAGEQFLGLHWWRLEPHAYFDPLRADIRSANVRVLFPAVSDAFPFSQSSGRRLVWDVTMGREIPLFGAGNYENQPADRPIAGRWAAGVWLPIGFHMIEDLKDPSGPILNVDYRFGVMVKIDRALSNTEHLALRFLGSHESTHIGDEFTIAARRLYPSFERINVSSEFWDLAGGWEAAFEPSAPVDEMHGTSRLRLVAGVMWLSNPDDGFYSSDTTETNGRVVPGSQRSAEPYLAAEYVSGSQLRLGYVREWAPFVSTEARNRIIYDFQRSAASIEEETQWSFNTLVGLWHAEAGPKDIGHLEFYLRYYYGVNPAGQFRTQRNYTLFGIGLQMSY